MNNPYKKNPGSHANKVPQFAAGSQQIKSEPNVAGPGCSRPSTNQGAEPTFSRRQHWPQQQHFMMNESQSDLQSRRLHTFINAPTSLTNLAQLSGISLLPVGGQQQSHQLLHNGANNTQVISFNNSQRPKITVSTSSGQNQQQAIKQNGVSFPNVVSSNADRVYNLETIPSIQLLNRVSNDHHNLSATISDPKVSAPRHRQSNLHTQACVQPSIANRKPRSQTNSNIANQREQHNNRVQVLPVSESIGLNFIPTSVKELQSIELANASARTSGSASPSSANQSNDNMSLMKLMAILNNPALTITPVGATSSQTHSSKEREVIWGNICQTIPAGNINDNGPQQQNISNPLSSSTPTSTYNLQSNSYNRRSDQTPNRNSRNNKLPKSAANLQLFYGGSVPPAVEPSNEAPTYNSGDGAPTDEQSSLTDPKINQKQYTGLNWLSSLAASRIEDKLNSVTLSWSSNTSNEKNLKFFTEDSALNRSIESPRDANIEHSSQKKLAEVAKDDVSNLTPVANESIFEPDCIISLPKINLQQLNIGARCQKIKHTVHSKTPRDKIAKEPIRSSKRRLYVPRLERKLPKKSRVSPDRHTIEIEINEDKEEAPLSERHFVLEKVNEIAEDVSKKRPIPVDPLDDIFVNKSKRVMSKIDMEMERRKKRRFEKISRRTSPNDPEMNDSSDNSDDGYLPQDSSNFFESTVVLIQLPLEEAITDQKREYFSSIGLISRDDKNKILLEQCENRLKNLCPAALQESGEIPEDIERFVDTIVQTGGTEIVLRTETDIKRNDLPFIEGLNRNTSRIKMNFMSALGLEKRSKRTTLYKVRPQENASTQIAKPQNDPNTKVKNLGNSFVSKARTVPEPSLSEPVKNNGATIEPCPVGNADFLRRAIKLAQASCREAIKAPNKDEYMKSLGLMAS